MSDIDRWKSLQAAREQWSNKDPDRDERQVDAAERVVMRKLLQRLTGGPGPYWNLVEAQIRKDTP